MLLAPVPTPAALEALEALEALVALLEAAHAGELGAIAAYEGHRRSLERPDERAALRRIQKEEHEHRREVRAMLAALGAEPDERVERRMRRIGRAISRFCRVGGWYAPMWGAGWLERGNIGEYERAAMLAARAGRHELVEPLLRMAEVEWDHADYFRERCRSHPLWHVLPLRELPGVRAAIRDRHAASLAPWRATLPAAVAP